MGTISTCMFQQEPKYSQYCNQCGVSILTSLFRYLMLQVNVNQCNYKFYVNKYIQRSLSLMYVFIRLASIDIT